MRRIVRPARSGSRSPARRPPEGRHGVAASGRKRDRRSAARLRHRSPPVQGVRRRRCSSGRFGRGRRRAAASRPRGIRRCNRAESARPCSSTGRGGRTPELEGTAPLPARRSLGSSRRAKTGHPEPNVKKTARSLATRRISLNAAARSAQWWRVRIASAASKLWSATGSRSAVPFTAGAAPGWRCAIIVAEGSTASTSRPAGSYEAAPAPMLITLRTFPRAARIAAAILGQAAACRRSSARCLVQRSGLGRLHDRDPTTAPAEIRGRPRRTHPAHFPVRPRAASAPLARAE
jgi:hypothetical protein